MKVPVLVVYGPTPSVSTEGVVGRPRADIVLGDRDRTTSAPPARPNSVRRHVPDTPARDHEPTPAR